MARMGYMGSAKIDDVVVYLTGSSLNPTQQINAPDVVQGRVIKKVWNWSKIEVGGNMSGPLTDRMGPIWDKATARDTDELDNNHLCDVTICYIEGGCRAFSGMAINSMEINVQAGEVANFTIDFMGPSWDKDAAASDVNDDDDCVMIVTWDQCEASIGGLSGEVNSASVSVANNVERLYRLNQDNMNAYKMLAGFKQITGSVAYYADGPPDEGSTTIEKCGQDVAKVEMTFGDCGDSMDIDYNAAVQRGEGSAGTGVGIYTYNFEVFDCD